MKPLKLMEYLVKLITPPKGTCLDPFLGSGTTLMACKKLGFNGIGIEREEEYCEIARKRLAETQTPLL
jgi:site-specific DNA-methyltransferase (adenine-specific)